jgi:hypothetical protein
VSQGKPMTPEKQLLNLIEKPMDKGSLRAAAIKYQGFGLFALDAFKGRLSFFGKNFSGFFKGGGIAQLDIHALNQFLKITVFLLTAYLIFNLTVSFISANKDLDLQRNIKSAGETSLFQPKSLLKSITYYLEKARERDIFKMGVRALSIDGALSRKGPSQRILEATSSLRLVGISWSDDPDVMVEDTKSQQTFFLKRGQLINNQIRLKAVFKDKVILNYEGEEIELR